MRSEYEVESKFIERLESIGYEYVELKNYDAVLSKAEFERVLNYVENNSVCIRSILWSECTGYEFIFY